MGTDNDEEERRVFDVLSNREYGESTVDSQEYDSSLENSASQINNFKKIPWLAEYFELIRENNQIYTACRVCNCRWKSRSLQRLLGHHNKCKSNSRGMDEIREEIRDQEQHDSSDTIRNKLLAEVIVENNLPLKCVESKSFKRFAAYTCRGWHLPSRRELSSLHIPKLARVLHQQFRSDVKKGRLNHLSIEFDHWTDANNRCYLGVIATSRTGNRHLVDLKDVSLRGHKSSVIVEDLIGILKSIPSEAINSFISDSAACCKKARQDLLEHENYKHCIQHRCLAHLLNNIGSKITAKNANIASTLKKASIITGVIKGSSYWTAYIRDMKERALSTVCRVRWYSTITMLTGLIRLKDVITDDIAPTLSLDDRVIIDNLSWSHLEEILEVLTPLNKCIGIIEKRGVSLGEAFNAILEFARGLFITDQRSETLAEARRSFLWYLNPARFGEAEFSLLLSAYALNRRFKLNYITESGRFLVLKSITRVALASKITMRRIESCLYDDFERYRHFEDEYGTHLDDEDQVKWWRDRVSSGMLSKVGVRIAHLKASSANIERTFSTVKNIQGNSRMRLLPSTLLELAQLKISYIDESEDDEIEIDFDRDRKLQQAALRELENTSHQENLDHSMNSSFASNTSSIALEYPPELLDWLENQDIDTKKDYQAFFKYIDFMILNDPTEFAAASSRDVTEDHIENYIKSIKANHRKKQRMDPNVIIESCTDDVVYLETYLPDETSHTSRDE